MRDLDRLAQGLRGYLRNGDKVTQVTCLSGGHSNETYLIHGIDKVMRMPSAAVPLLPSGLGVRAQFDLFAALAGKRFAPPVPRMDLFCDDPQVLGAPFFLMELVEGGGVSHWDISGLLESLDLAGRVRLSQDYVEMVAGLTRIGCLELLGPARPAADEFDRWCELVGHLRLPKLEALMTSLASSFPADLPPSIVHGDCVFANMLWRDGRLAAVLDWELGFNGDPRWDLGYVIGQFDGPGGPGTPGFDLPGMWQRDRILEFWEAASGYSTEGLEWFECAGRAKAAAILLYGQHLWDSGQSGDERLSVWGAAAERIVAKGEALLQCLA